MVDLRELPHPALDAAGQAHAIRDKLAVDGGTKAQDLPSPAVPDLFRQVSVDLRSQSLRLGGPVRLRKDEAQVFPRKAALLPGDRLPVRVF